MKKVLMNMGNARLSDQLRKMVEIEKHGICPFCPKYFLKYHEAPIIKETKNWILTKNDYPYEGAELHLLFIPKKHIEKISDIKAELSLELISLAGWAEKRFGVIGGGLFIRFGNIKYNAASIAHLHVHMVMGTKEGRGREKLTVRIGFKK